MHHNLKYDQDIIILIKRFIFIFMWSEKKERYDINNNIHWLCLVGSRLIWLKWIVENRMSGAYKDKEVALLRSNDIRKKQIQPVNP